MATVAQSDRSHDAGRRLTKINVHARDEQRRTIKDLRQDEFVIEEDEKEQVIEWWKKSNEFGRVRYQLGYVPRRERDGKNRRIDVRVRRPGVVAEFSPKQVR